MPNFPTPPNNNRIGFHYYPDFNHFREKDLVTWLPKLKSLGASWLTLTAPSDRAIPESFLTGLKSAGIEPILQFQFRLDQPPAISDLKLIFHNYARWGVNYAVLFDQPNVRSAWSPASWAQTDLVERFLDLFVPPAETAAKSGLIPVFPPLKPGGDYWDTAFLRASLQALVRRGNFYLLDRLALAAIAFAGNRPLGWGSGGPERWPESRPYHTKNGKQDQCGFLISDWYTATSQAIIGESKPILLFKLGSSTGIEEAHGTDQKSHVRRTIDMVQALASPLNQVQARSYRTRADTLPQEVICGNFWLLTACSDDPGISHAWFSPQMVPSPKVHALTRWNSWANGNNSKARQEVAAEGSVAHSIPHYLVLPAYDWGVTDWHLNAARPFIRKYRPMIGFSLDYAIYADKVTVIGDETQFPESALDNLRNSGCRVERINGDGISIATQLIEK